MRVELEDAKFDSLAKIASEVRSANWETNMIAKCFVLEQDGQCALPFTRFPVVALFQALRNLLFLVWACIILHPAHYILMRLMKVKLAYSLFEERVRCVPFWEAKLMAYQRMNAHLRRYKSS